jgi:nucleoside-diphosphate-sugar epimerase
MPRTLITGITGFTGPYVADLLIKRGHAVFGVAHGGARSVIDGVDKIYHADITKPDEIWAVVDEVRPSHVVHLAAISFVAHSDIEEMYRSNVVGTRLLLEALSKLSDRPCSVLLSSSANVYGNAREGILDENMNPAPANDYGVSKLAMEFVAKIYEDSLPLIVVRPFNYTGRGQGIDFVIPKIVAHARERAASIKLGDLDVKRDFSDVRAVADAYVRLLENPSAIGRTFNVCSGQAHSLRDVIELVEELSGHRMTIEVNPAYFRENEVKTLYGSNALLTDCIGPLNVLPLIDTLRWMLV